MSEKNQRAYIGFYGLTCIIINNIIGSGIFSAPSSIIQSANSIGSAICIWFVTGLIATTGALVYAELGSVLTFSGGDTNYLNFIKWKGLSFTFTITIVFILYPTVLCIQALTFSEYFLQACRFGFITTDNARWWANIVVAFLVILIIVVINLWLNSAHFLRFIIVLTATKVLLLLAAIVVACIKGKFSNLNRPFENSTLNPDDVVGSFYNSWFSFDGYDIVATSVEEIIDPQIILPKAISCSMLTVIAMYLLINVSYALVLGTDQMIKSENIVNDFAEVLLGKQSYLIPVLACICLFGAIYGTVFEIGRITHAMARDGVIPKCLSGWNEDKNIPRPAIFVHFVFGVIFLFLMNLNELNTLNAAQYVSQWLQRAISVFVLLFIRVNRFPVGESVFRMNILFPCLYLVCLVSMALSTVATDWQTSIFTIAASGGGLIIYWTLQWPKGLRRSGTIDRMLKSLDGKLRIQNGTN